MKVSSSLVLSATILLLSGCVKTEAPAAEVKAAEKVPPKKERNIMRFEDKPKPPASTHAGEL